MINPSQVFTRLESALAMSERLILLASLQPGIGSTEVQTQLNHANLSSLPIVERLYEWKNGTRTDNVTLDDIHLFPGFYFLSLEDAIANYRSFVVDSRWTVGWLPIFANGGGDFYVIALADSDRGSIRHFRIDENSHPIEFLGLDVMLTTLASSFESRVFYVDSSGYLEMNDDAFFKLAAELNPEVPWWTAEI